MRILLANTAAYPVIGGVENSLRFIGRELLQAGHEVRIFCLQMAPSEPLRMEYEGIVIVRQPYQPSRWPHARLRGTVAAAREGSRPIIDDFKPDAVWSRSAPMGQGIRDGGYRGPLLQIFPTNSRMNCRGQYLQTRGLPWKRRLLLMALWPLAYFPSARLERSLARQSTAVAFSENMRKQLVGGFPRGARKCHVVAPGVDSELYSPEHGARYYPRLARDFQLFPGDPTVLYVGRLSISKHIPMLVDAMTLLKVPARLVLVGAGPDEANLRAYAERKGLSSRVLFAGSQGEMLPGFYAISRVSVLPTTTESFGQVYLESLACGTPAVGFAGDGDRVLTATSEILRDGETGGVATRVSAAALAEKIDAILALDDVTYETMSVRARAVARADYSWRSFVDRALAISVSPDGILM
ncbi:MAG: glycosyltransferase family 4 protein [Candidatus Hydrogenedentes bacterium]|nr:glycosyltransferase family 4 protein [Candidatus Hydrogenedentota bacterium]